MFSNILKRFNFTIKNNALRSFSDAKSKAVIAKTTAPTPKAKVATLFKIIDQTNPGQYLHALRHRARGVTLYTYIYF